MSFNNDFNMYIPTRVLFGSGKLNQLHKQEMPGKKALIVTSNGNSVKINGYLERVEKELEKIRVGYFLFDEVEPNPLKSTVMRGAKVAIENNCDFIIALGGGSPMDAAKAISIMATNEGDLWDYVTEGTGKGKTLKMTLLN
ncbi:iron-containing alcohol dehydrogenase [Methanobrevibacter arboriphilus]|uniref:iron-containing alcohol dehydrogenase n=1 Tax=Methanobrevibacter arboriphilus TaxID=39441 RepID=UPI000B0B0B1A|nr:iron-containing alcohol dehydrogenase [Methanobrevibacter arboriphilus]